VAQSEAMKLKETFPDPKIARSEVIGTTID